MLYQNEPLINNTDKVEIIYNLLKLRVDDHATLHIGDCEKVFLLSFRLWDNVL
jgi:hypothetical protein